MPEIKSSLLSSRAASCLLRSAAFVFRASQFIPPSNMHERVRDFHTRDQNNPINLPVATASLGGLLFRFERYSRGVTVMDSVHQFKRTKSGLFRKACLM